MVQHADAVVIRADGLGRSFTVQRKAAGIGASLRGLFRRETEEVRALDDATFTGARGERLGVLGPNGAGKTTLMKLLTGILTPSRGSATVLGFTPSERKRAFLTRIALVLGGKGALLWDLPANESFLLAQAMYEIDAARFSRNVRDLTERLVVTDLLDIPVRKLSLGQRMRLELVLALLHDPDVLFLDEPTLGLDVVSQHHVREFLKHRSETAGTTILLTSHYMEDITSLCERVLIIDQGRIAADALFRDLVETVATEKEIELVLREPVSKERLATYGTVVSVDAQRVVLTVPRAMTAAATARILQELPVQDVNVREPEASTIVRELFARKGKA